MKKRMLVISLLLAMILTGCGDSASGTGQSVQIHESMGKEDNVKEEEAQEEASVAEYNDHYVCVQKVEDSANPSNNKFTFVGGKGVFEITGYKEVGKFFYGTAVARDVDGQYTLIDTNGNQIIEAGIYRNIERIDGNSGYFAIYDEQKKYGVMNYEGQVIVPCEYERVQGMGNNLEYVFCCEKEGLNSLYSAKRLKIMSDVSAGNFDYLLIDNVEGKDGLIKVWVDDLTYYFSEKSGELLLTEGEEIKYVEFDIHSGVLCYETPGNYSKVIKLLNEDFTGFIDVEFPADMRTTGTLGIKDRILIIDGDNDTRVYSRQGEFLHDFGQEVTAMSASDGSIWYIECFNQDMTCKIYDGDFKQVGIIENTKNPTCAENFFISGEYEPRANWPHVLHLYDREGKLLYENIVSKATEMFLYQLADGSYIYKKDGSDELIEVTLETDERYMARRKNWYFFTKDNEIILRNEKLEEVSRFAAGVEIDYDLFYLRDGDKYYNFDGKLLYEKK